MVSGLPPVLYDEVRKQAATVIDRIRRGEEPARCTAGRVDPGSARFRIGSGVERTSARLKEEFGGHHVGVRGHSRAPAIHGRPS